MAVVPWHSWPRQEVDGGSHAAARVMHSARYHAAVFLWGLAGWTAKWCSKGSQGADSTEYLDVAPGDLWLLPVGDSGVHLSFERINGLARGQALPIWLEVWYFGDGEPGRPSETHNAGVGASAGASIAERVARIVGLECQHLTGT